MPFSRKTADEKDARAAEKEAAKEGKGTRKASLSILRRHPLARRAAHTRGSRRSFRTRRREVDEGRCPGALKGVGQRDARVAALTRASRALNAVADEGWELVTGSFVFVGRVRSAEKQGLSRPDKQVAISGTVVGYTSSSETRRNKVQLTDPWDETDDAAVEELAEAIGLISLGHASRS